MKNYKLDPEEKAILKAYNAGEFKTINDPKALARYQEYAKYTLQQKTKNINIRLTLKDLLDLKNRAAQSGLPYQTLVSLLIRQFNENKLPLTI